MRDTSSIRHLIVLAASAVLLWVAAEWLRLDQRLSALFYDAGRGGFFLRDDPLWRGVGHDGLKHLSAALWLVLLGVTCLPSPLMPRPWTRRAAAQVLLGVLLGALLIPGLKRLSAHSCPWDLDLFGGGAQWFALFGTTPPAPGGGHCFPGGHASSGFSWISAWFALRHDDARWARIALWAALVFGALCSVVQVVRGAHFVSHNLWTLWILWLFNLGFDRVFVRYRRRHPMR